MYIEVVDANIMDGVKITLLGFIGQPSIGKSGHNGVDCPSDLLDGLIFLLLLRLTFASLLVMPLSPSIFYFIPPSIDIMIFVLVVLVPSGSRSCWVIVRLLHKLG